MIDRERCRYTIEGKRVRVGGKMLPWWRRYCKRLAEPGKDRCWQHRRAL